MGLALLVALTAASTAFAATTWYDEDNVNLNYSGSWLVWTDPAPPALGFYGPTMKYSNAAGAEVTFSFSGMAVDYRAWTGPIYGTHEIVLDGVAEPVNLYAPAYSSQVVWSKTGLAPNVTHTMTIRRTTNAYISVDAIGIDGAMPPAPVVSTPASSTWSIALGLLFAVGLLTLPQRVKVPAA